MSYWPIFLDLENFWEIIFHMSKKKSDLDQMGHIVTLSSITTPWIKFYVCADIL